MDQQFRLDDSDEMCLALPVIGIYSCLYCEKHFSTKRDLKRHYRGRHVHCIPRYEGTRRRVSYA